MRRRFLLIYNCIIVQRYKIITQDIVISKKNKKNRKKGLTKGEVGDIIIKLSEERQIFIRGVSIEKDLGIRDITMQKNQLKVKKVENEKSFKKLKKVLDK